MSFAALPTINTVVECADYTRTVAPYVSQLSQLPYHVWDTLRTNPAALVHVYQSTNPLVFGFAFSLFLVPIFVLVSEINRNYSQVDRVWSILPTVYNAHYTLWAHVNGLQTGRLDMLLAASILWTTRLTFNYWRKGGYTVGSEDYRWEIVRKNISPPLFFILNVLFISLWQSVLLFSITMPTYVLLLLNRFATSTSKASSLDTTDIVFAGLIASLVTLTFLADEQQWQYQTAKHEYNDTAKMPANSKFSQAEFERGFLVRGLFAWSRHPNFAFEQSVWATLYAWAAVKSQSPVNWTIIGPILYLSLFQPSTVLTEWISSSKYPEYKEYQELVGMFLPFKLWPILRLGPVSPQDFEQSKGRKAIANGPADLKNAEDKEKAKTRYDLR